MTILPNGGEIVLKHHDERLVYDRIELDPSGMVVCINKSGYQLDAYPMEQIQEINTYTKHLEDEEWW